MLIISLINFSFSFVSFFVADSKVWATLGELLRCATIRARLASKNSALICSRSVANDSLIHPIPPVPDPNPDPALVDVVVVVVVVDGIVIREADLIGSVPGDPQVSAGIGGNYPPLLPFAPPPSSPVGGGAGNGHRAETWRARVEMQNEPRRVENRENGNRPRNLE